MGGVSNWASERGREAPWGAALGVCLGLALMAPRSAWSAQEPAQDAPSRFQETTEPVPASPEQSQAGTSRRVLPPEMRGGPPPGGELSGTPGGSLGAATGQGEPEPEPEAEPQPIAPAELAPAEQGRPLYAPRYRSRSEALELGRALAAAVPEAARVLEIPVADGATSLMAVEFGRPGPVPLEERPTVLVLGGLDGRSLAGGEAAFAVIARLCAVPERLPPDVAFVVVPWAAPEALARRFAGEGHGREFGSPAIDDDRDGAFDEDGPDDIDGDGMVLEMLVEDEQGDWTFSSDPRFLVPVAEGEGPRYRRVPEGRDDDGDGLFNEDGPRGVALDRNFPLGRQNAWLDPLCGATPLCDPSARALADLALARRTVAVLLMQGYHGGLALPGGAAGPEGAEFPLAGDRRVYGRVAQTFATLAGRTAKPARALRLVRGAEVSGAALDWFYAGVGALALEIAPWGPHVEGGGDVLPRDARFTPHARSRDLSSRPPPGEDDLAWGTWLDDTRGGLGFVEWHPVDAGGGVQALVGGWEPYTQENPPVESLGRALLGLPEFVASLGAGVPRLELRDVRAPRDGNVVTLSARVKNAGSLPTGLWGGAGPVGRGDLTVTLELPPGARLLAGRLEERLGRLEGGELSSELNWIVFTPEGAELSLTALSEHALPVRQELLP